MQNTRILAIFDTGLKNKVHKYKKGLGNIDNSKTKRAC